MIVICILALLWLLALWAGRQFDSWAIHGLSAVLGFALAAVIARRLWQLLRARNLAAGMSGRRVWLRLAVISGAALTLGALGIVVGMCYLRAWSLVHPKRAPVDRAPESAGILEYQAVTFASSGGLMLRGWYAPSRNGAAVVFVHGQGTNRTGLLQEAGLLNRQGFGALLFDLRNQGESDGTVTTLGLRESDDVIAAVRFVQAQPGIDPKRIVLVGQSMGGASALIAAPRLPEVRGLVVECSYTSLEENIATGVLGMGLPVFPFAPMIAFFGEREAGITIAQVRPIDSLALYNRPLLIIHGGRDGTLPVKNAYALYDAASEPKSLYIVPEAGHCDFEPTAGPDYEKRLVEFVQSASK